MTSGPSDRAMKLAIVTGLRSALGPALIARAQHRPEAQTLALMALGEMVVDKLPLIPSRDTLLPLLARGIAGYWVAQRCAEEDGVNDPWAPALGAAVAMGVAVVAPKVRRTLGLGAAQPLLGLIEDYLALKLGAEATGLTFDDLAAAARETVSSLGDQVGHAAEAAGLPHEWTQALNPAGR